MICKENCLSWIEAADGCQLCRDNCTFEYHFVKLITVTIRQLQDDRRRPAESHPFKILASPISTAFYKGNSALLHHFAELKDRVRERSKVIMFWKFGSGKQCKIYSSNCRIWHATINNRSGSRWGEAGAGSRDHCIQFGDISNRVDIINP